MSVAWVGAGIAAVGTISSVTSGNKALKQQQAQVDAQTQLAMQQLEAQTKNAEATLAFNKEVYADSKERQKGIDAINNDVVQQSLSDAKKASARSDESYAYYLQNGRPVVEKSIKDASQWDSQGNIDAARGRATADVAQAAGIAEQDSQRALARMGVNPSSGRFLALQQRLQADKAAASAGAATNAEQGIRDQAVNLRQQAANLAQGFPAISSGQAGQAGQLGVSAAGVAGAGGAQNAAIGANAINGMSSAGSQLGSVAGGYSQLASNSLARLGQVQQGAAANSQGWGQLGGALLSSVLKGGGGGSLGGFSISDLINGTGLGGGLVNGGQVGRDGGTATIGGNDNSEGKGGKIAGPGTGTSDSVNAVNQDNGQPVRLSNGEYVVSADTVRALGTRFFDNLQKKHHKHVNMKGAA